MIMTISGNNNCPIEEVCQLLEENNFVLFTERDAFEKMNGAHKITKSEALENKVFFEVIKHIFTFNRCYSENVAYQSNMAWHIIPDSFRVLLKGEMNEDDVTEQEHCKRFYQVDIFDKDNYDLVINTEGKTTEEIIAKILRRFEEYKKEQSKYRIYYWYIDDELMLHGTVTHRKGYFDGEDIVTSVIKSVKYNENTQEVIIKTRNSKYYAKLEYWDVKKQAEYEEYRELMPDYKTLLDLNKSLQKEHTIEPGNILVCFSNFDDVMFHSFYCMEKEGTKPVEHFAIPHTGTFRDSFIIRSNEVGVDIRYYWNWGINKFYMVETKGMPLWFENVGDRPIYMRLDEERELHLRPGERRQMYFD